MQCFDMAMTTNPENVRAWNNKAFLLLQLRKYFEARICLYKAYWIPLSKFFFLLKRSFKLTSTIL